LAQPTIALQRLYNQRLDHTSLTTAQQVVACLGAVQAQDYASAKWSLGMRMLGATDSSIERAFDAGDIVRTHVMRPTWHFVAPADIRWLLALTARRVHAVNGTMYRKLELDDATLVGGATALTRALSGGKCLTRPELQSALTQDGIVADNLRLGYVVHYAELEGLICSGPRRGKHFTYALLDERVLPTKPLTQGEALAELTKRYFTSHGPATAQDFAWWSGLTFADVTSGLDAIRTHLAQEVMGGQTFWFPTSTPAKSVTASRAYVLPEYDEFLLSYRDRSASLSAEHAAYWTSPTRLFTSTIMIGGRVVGLWRRTLQKGTIVIESRPFAKFTVAQSRAFEAAARSYGEFFGMPVVLK